MVAVVVGFDVTFAAADAPNVSLEGRPVLDGVAFCLRIGVWMVRSGVDDPGGMRAVNPGVLTLLVGAGPSVIAVDDGVVVVGVDLIATARDDASDLRRP